MRLKKAVYSAIVGISLFSTGCIGQFGLTHKVLEWNLQTGQNNKWFQEGLFLLLNFLPVYGGAVLVDGIVLNSVEFWTGTNPITNKKAITGASERSTANAEMIAVTEKVDSDSIRVSIYDDGHLKQSFLIDRTSDGIKAIATDGSVMGSVDRSL
jgi:hypothetical protein